MNWSDLLVAPPAGEVHTRSTPCLFFVFLLCAFSFQAFAFLFVLQTCIDANVGGVAARSTTAFTRSPLLCNLSGDIMWHMFAVTTNGYFVMTPE